MADQVTTITKQRRLCQFGTLSKDDLEAVVRVVCS